MDDATYDFGEEEASAEKPRRPGLPVEPQRLLWIVRDHRKRLLKAFLIASVFALLGSFFVPQTWNARVRGPRRTLLSILRSRRAVFERCAID